MAEQFYKILLLFELASIETQTDVYWHCGYFRFVKSTA